MVEFRFRPHHIFCERFMKFEVPDRGEEYDLVEQKIRNIIETVDTAVVEIIEGVDELCLVCPD